MRQLMLAGLFFLAGGTQASEKHVTLSVTCTVVVAPAVSTVTYTRLPNNIVIKTVYY